MIRDYKISTSVHQNQPFFATFDNRYQKICSALVTNERVTPVNLTLIFDEVIRSQCTEILAKLIQKYHAEFSKNEMNVRKAYSHAEKTPKNPICKHIMRMLEDQMKILREKDENEKLEEQKNKEIARNRILIVSFDLGRMEVIFIRLVSKCIFAYIFSLRLCRNCFSTCGFAA
jgi:hypothetical protein